MFRRMSFFLVGALLGCSSQVPDPIEAGASGSAGVSGAAGQSGSSGAGGAGPLVDAAVDGVDSTGALIFMRMDNIVGEPIVDAASPLRSSVPFEYTFDTGIDGWILTPLGPTDPLRGKSLSFSNEDFAGATNSGSLEVRWEFPWIAAPEPIVRVRAFSAEPGSPRDWTGYRITAQAKKSVNTYPCPVKVTFYVLAGADRQVAISNGFWLPSTEWMKVTFDLSSLSGFADASQIYEFGIYVDHDVCAPP